MPAGFSSQPGHLIVRSQPTQGTIATDLTTAGLAVKLRSGSLGTDRDLMIPDAEIGGTRDVVDSYLGGNVKWSGDYEMYLRVDSFLTFLRAALGSSSSSTTTGVTTHTITPADTQTLPYLSLEEQIGAGLERYRYFDAVVNTLHMECDSEGYAMATASLIAANQQAGTANVDPTSLFDNTPMIIGANVTLTLNGVAFPAHSFSLDINNNFDDSDFVLGSFYLNSLSPKRREVTIGANIRQTSSALWRQAVYGQSGLTQPGGVPTKQPIVLTLQTYETISGGTPATTRQISFTIPNAIIKPFNLEPSGDDLIDTDVEFEAVRPNPATGLLTVTAKTGLAAIA